MPPDDNSEFMPMTAANVTPGTRFRHRRARQQYTVMATGWNGETGEPVIVYQSVGRTPKVWVSPATAFFNGQFLLIPGSRTLHVGGTTHAPR